MPCGDRDNLGRGSEFEEDEENREKRAGEEVFAVGDADIMEELDRPSLARWKIALPPRRGEEAALRVEGEPE